MWVVRLTVIILELVGLFYTVRLSHEGKYMAALLLLLVDSAILVLFVYSYCFIEEVLDKYERKNRGRWWL